MSYTLKDTPCGDVVGKTICCFPKDVRHLFPKDAVLQQLKKQVNGLCGRLGQPPRYATEPDEAARPKQ